MPPSYSDDCPLVATDGRCPSCHAAGQSVFHEVSPVPVRSGHTARTRAEALNDSMGSIRLALCPACGAVTNISFDASLERHPSDAETLRPSSDAFDAFHYRLATELISRHRLHRKTIADIGCGSGEFLSLLCEFGDNRGVGFDPSCTPRERRASGRDRITFIRDRYLDRYADYSVDFICCKMTLEHVQDTAGLIAAVRRAIRDRKDVVAFFMVEDVRRLLQDVAFWDVNYGRCSYFDRESLAHLFRLQGFDVLQLWSDGDGRHLMIEVRPTGGSKESFRRERAAGQAATQRSTGRQANIASDVRRFARRAGRRVRAWETALRKLHEQGERIAVWGADSKAASFLAAARAQREVSCIVDTDPAKHDSFLVGSGHRVVAPEALYSLNPDRIVVSDPSVRSHVLRDLGAMGLSAQLHDVGEDPGRIIESNPVLFT